jgi:hypothetical protein
MACQITFKDRFVQLNNMQFSRLIDFGIQIGERTAKTEESHFIARMKKSNNEEFWPGRGFDISADFSAVDEQKFWCRVFFDTSRAIFDRQVGNHEHSFWQAQSIHQSHAAALLFQEAVREIEPQWTPDTLDYREFNKTVNRKTG